MSNSQTELREHLLALEASGVVGLSTAFQPAEWAAIVPRLEPEELRTLFDWLPEDDAATVLAALDPHAAADVLQVIGHAQAAAALDEMPEDDAADVLEALSDEQARAFLTAMPAGEADDLRDLGQFDPDTAGGIMSPGFIAMAPDLHADQAISALRKIARRARTDHLYLHPRSRRPPARSPLLARVGLVRAGNERFPT